MNRRFVITIVFIGVVILLFSFGIKKFITRRSSRLIERVSSENLDMFKGTLLSSAKNFMEKNDYVKASNALKTYVEKFPESENVPVIKKEIENLNIKVLFSDLITDDDFYYKIKSGDTLGKIASRFNTTVELLKRSNGLKNDLIVPGKVLKVNKTPFSILIDRSENILVLKRSNDKIVKTYNVSTGENLSTPIGTFKIEEKLVSPIWYKVGAVVEPNSPEYELGSRWMGLSVEGYGIHGTNDASSIGKHMTKGCVRMFNGDVKEVYAIVPSGTEVVIVE